MKTLRLGIIGTSDIAFRRFLPALSKSSEFEYVGVASRELDKTKKFVETYGGRGYSSYDELLYDEKIDVVYVPLPPALHYEWGKRALESGKHIFLEKPATTNKKHTKKLIEIARDRGLAVHENYMFAFHSQLHEIIKLIDSGEIGDIRLYRISFGFPKRADNDFRYNKEMGGGSLLDCGGYPIKLATLLLGESAHITTSCLNFVDNYEVDLFGTATIQNNDGVAAQVSFGMDNSYKCELEAWGSKGCIFTDRIFTAPSDFMPSIVLTKDNRKEIIKLNNHDQFLESINFFKKCIVNDNVRLENYLQILHQQTLVDNIFNMNGVNI